MEWRQIKETFRFWCLAQRDFQTEDEGGRWRKRTFYFKKDNFFCRILVVFLLNLRGGRDKGRDTTQRRVSTSSRKGTEGDTFWRHLSLFLCLFLVRPFKKFCFARFDGCSLSKCSTILTMR